VTFCGVTLNESDAAHERFAPFDAPFSHRIEPR
jgi:hypothetical protein